MRFRDQVGNSAGKGKDKGKGKGMHCSSLVFGGPANEELEELIFILTGAFSR